MKIQGSAAKRFENGSSCTVPVYELPSARPGLAKAEIRGRYPEKGRCVNHACDETYLVESGSCVVHAEGEAHPLREGDAFFFPAETRYWVEAQNVTLVVSTGPAWTPEQHEYLE